MKLLPTTAIAAALTIFSIQSASACACGCNAKKAAAPAKAEQHAYKVIDTAAVAAAVAAKTTIVDARGGKFLDERRIPGAKVVAANSSEKEITAALPDKDAKIVTYCTNLKCPASKMLATKLVAMGYTNVEKYPAGIDGWEAAGKPVEKAAK
jgi:rhodanese-related sulfurtransferase